jgi:hypothetical protein
MNPLDLAPILPTGQERSVGWALLGLLGLVSLLLGVLHPLRFVACLILEFVKIVREQLEALGTCAQDWRAELHRWKTFGSNSRDPMRQSRAPEAETESVRIAPPWAEVKLRRPVTQASNRVQDTLRSRAPVNQHSVPEATPPYSPAPPSSARPGPSPPAARRASSREAPDRGRTAGGGP